MARTGDLLAQDILPALGDAFRNRYGGAVDAASDSLAGAQQRAEIPRSFSKRSWGWQIGPAARAGIETFASVVSVLGDNLDLLAGVSLASVGVALLGLKPERV